MATIYIDRQSGNWKLKTKLNGSDKRITLRKARDGETNEIKPADVLALAKQHGAVLNTETRHSGEPTPNSDSLMEFMDWFGVEYPKHKTRGTAIKMERILRYFRNHLDGKDCPVASVTADMVRAWAESRLADPRVGGTTVKGDLIYLSSLFKAALDRDIIVKNPVSPVLKEYGKAYPYADDIKYLTDGELKNFLDRVDTLVGNGKLRLDFADLFKVMLATGMRVSAAVNLRWDWLTSEWMIKVPATTDDIPTKTKTGYEAAIGDLGRKVLERRRKEHGAVGRVFSD